MSKNQFFSKKQIIAMIVAGLAIITAIDLKVLPKIIPSENTSTIYDENYDVSSDPYYYPSNNDTYTITEDGTLIEGTNISLNDIPEFQDDIPYVELNNNVPNFTDEEKTITETFENYSDLDSLGRCGVAYANLSLDTMPAEERGKIGMIKPSGWHTVKYDNVDGKYLYNRCHLIGFQLAGENANEKNLITGTRYLNVTGMLPFENKVADYIETSQNHVLYRVTPIYDGNNLLASGVQMEAYSVEDKGFGICFNVYCYNAQPGITIDYATGESHETTNEEKTYYTPASDDFYEKDAA